MCIASEGRGIPETHQKWGGWWNKLYPHHLETLKSKDEEMHKRGLEQTVLSGGEKSGLLCPCPAFWTQVTWHKKR